MTRGSSTETRSPIDRSSSRSVFSDLVASALAEAKTRVDPLTRSYLIDLLDRQLVVAPGTAVHARDNPADLAEALVSIRESGDHEELSRIPELRELGDRALFVAGFFRASLKRRGASRSDYADVGRTAYSEISHRLVGRVAEPSWPGLFRGLAERFGEFEELLAEVGGWSRPDPETDLLELYDRCARTGSVRDRAELQRRGLAPPSRFGRGRC